MQCRRCATYLSSHLFPAENILGTLLSSRQSELDELSSPSASPLPVQTVPSHTSCLKITLKLPTQKPVRVCRATHKDNDPDSAVECEDDSDQPRSGSNWHLTSRQAVFLRASLARLTSHWVRNTVSITRRSQQTLKRLRVSAEDEKVRIYILLVNLSVPHISRMRRLQPAPINRLRKTSGMQNRRNVLGSAEDRSFYKGVKWMEWRDYFCKSQDASTTRGQNEGCVVGKTIIKR
jgi:hypothetical protein